MVLVITCIKLFNFFNDFQITQYLPLKFTKHLVKCYKILLHYLLPYYESQMAAIIVSNNIENKLDKNLN